MVERCENEHQLRDFSALFSAWNDYLLQIWDPKLKIVGEHPKIIATQNPFILDHKAFKDIDAVLRYLTKHLPVCFIDQERIQTPKTQNMVNLANYSDSRLKPPFQHDLANFDSHRSNFSSSGVSAIHNLDETRMAISRLIEPIRWIILDFSGTEIHSRVVSVVLHANKPANRVCQVSVTCFSLFSDFRDISLKTVCQAGIRRCGGFLGSDWVVLSKDQSSVVSKFTKIGKKTKTELEVHVHQLSRIEPESEQIGSTHTQSRPPGLRVCLIISIPIKMPKKADNETYETVDLPFVFKTTISGSLSKLRADLEAQFAQKLKKFTKIHYLDKDKSISAEIDRKAKKVFEMFARDIDWQQRLCKLEKIGNISNSVLALKTIKLAPKVITTNLDALNGPRNQAYSFCSENLKISNFDTKVLLPVERLIGALDEDRIAKIDPESPESANLIIFDFGPKNASKSILGSKTYKSIQNQVAGLELRAIIEDLGEKIDDFYFPILRIPKESISEHQVKIKNFEQGTLFVKLDHGSSESGGDSVDLSPLITPTASRVNFKKVKEDEEDPWALFRLLPGSVERVRSSEGFVNPRYFVYTKSKQNY